MATTLTHPEAAAAFGSSPTPETGPGRLVSLDAFRGFIMLLLVSNGFGLGVLEHYPNWAWLAKQVDHTAWEGCTFWDLIQPAFTFMVGVAMPSLSRGASRKAPPRWVSSNTWRGAPFCSSC